MQVLGLIFNLLWFFLFRVSTLNTKHCVCIWCIVLFSALFLVYISARLCPHFDNIFHNIFLDYGNDKFNYRLWDLVDKKIIQS